MRAAAPRPHPPLHHRPAAARDRAGARRPTSCASSSPGSGSIPRPRHRAGEPGGARSRQLEGLRGGGVRLGGRDPAGADGGVRPLLARRPLPRRPLVWGRGAPPASRRRGPASGSALRPDAGRRRSPSSAARASASGGSSPRRPRRSTSRPARERLRLPAAPAAPPSSARSPRAPGSSTPRLEEALAELVAWGLVTSDSFTGLRALLMPANKRPPIDRVGSPRPRRAGVALFGMENAGRWSPCAPRKRRERPPSPWPGGAAAAPESRPEIGNETVEAVAWALLHRYGVVFRTPPRARDAAAALARPPPRLPPSGSARRDPRRPFRRRLLRRAVRPGRGGRAPPRHAQASPAAAPWSRSPPPIR